MEDGIRTSFEQRIEQRNGKQGIFKGIGKIKFEGKESENPLAFKYYNPDQVVAGKTMRDYFKFSTAYLYTFCGQGSDSLGHGSVK